MSDAIAIAASGLKSQEYSIDSLAHDIANLNTSNYKSTQLTFEDVLYQNINATSKRESAQLGLGTAVYKTGKNFNQGPLKPSNNWNDVAIDGNGFFQVIDHEGNILYTRSSNFKIDEDHFLATENGLRLADNIQIPDGFVEITIQENGDVEATRADESHPQLLGTIQLAQFVNPESLSPLGSGLYRATEQAGDVRVDNPGTNGLGALLQKQIEGSNVDMVNTLMQLTLTQRIYQLNAKAMQVADELEKMTNELHA